MRRTARSKFIESSRRRVLSARPQLSVVAPLVTSVGRALPQALHSCIQKEPFYNAIVSSMGMPRRKAMKTLTLSVITLAVSCASALAQPMRLDPSQMDLITAGQVSVTASAHAAAAASDGTSVAEEEVLVVIILSDGTEKIIRFASSTTDHATPPVFLLGGE